MKKASGLNKGNSYDSYAALNSSATSYKEMISLKLVNEIITERLAIVDADESDISLIIEMEKHPANRDFVWVGTYDEHLSEMNDAEHLLLVFKHIENNAPIGYSLSRVDLNSEVYELRRFIITDKGKGYGREAMRAHLKYVFEELKMNRFWLDVFPDNAAGIKLYESFNMHCDGVLSQNYKADRGYLDQIVYSMLKSEYFLNKKSR